MYKNYLKIMWPQLVWQELLGVAKFLILTVGVLYAFSVFSLANGTPNEVDCFSNQRNDGTVNNISAHTSKPFALDGTPISLIRWID